MIFKIQDFLFSQIITDYNGMERLQTYMQKKKKKIETIIQSIFKKNVQSNKRFFGI